LIACARPPWPITVSVSPTSTPGGAAALEPRRPEAGQRLDQAETRRLVVQDRPAADDVTAIGREPDRRGFGDQVADGQDQAIGADHRAIAAALGAEDAGGECIVGDDGAHLHHRVERAGEVEPQFVQRRLQRFGRGPFLMFWHGRILT
jgi:hypothetical protein